MLQYKEQIVQVQVLLMLIKSFMAQFMVSKWFNKHYYHILIQIILWILKCAEMIYKAKMACYKNSLSDSSRAFVI